MKCGERKGKQKYFVCDKAFAEYVEGSPMCTFHAAMRKRMRANEQRRRQADADRELLVQGWVRRMQDAAGRLKVDAQLGTLGPEYVERVSISLKDFERLAAVTK